MRFRRLGLARLGSVRQGRAIGEPVAPENILFFYLEVATFFFPTVSGEENSPELAPRPNASQSLKATQSKRVDCILHLFVKCRKTALLDLGKWGEKLKNWRTNDAP